MKIKLFAGCLGGVLAAGFAYADPLSDQGQIYYQGQMLVQNEEFNSGKIVTGIGASGEKETATLDQNGRWHAGSPQPAENDAATTNNTPTTLPTEPKKP